jgi:hypothetical protein
VVKNSFAHANEERGRVMTKKERMIKTSEPREKQP